ncbi:LysR family transcriptional regulator, glycine cleavage system transcriptional activator [Cribrihabitans marinus]|uniref:LysR family transcriptional regulator, glycine cleavage system transcriptional activator n=2 Tax=Cribrihabitans marinus TaxID=1227549 RepID=A0A1H7A1K1_9RHOB|nr:transcriptional regulator [Cribrihabitans marinus]SEJ57767.1 LysR family transcriptional regulator, glycine cleavage system transcriptional activator [Cribrihabitans marinus]
MAIREGSLKAAAGRLGITAAAVGQRIRALEDYLGSDLLVRGRSGLQPTPELAAALPDLQAAFQSLDRVSSTLDFQRISEIHIVADPDWSELWLAPRLPAFREAHQNILFCINGAGDVPTRLGAPDIRVEYGGAERGDALFTDYLVPVCSPDNLRRIADYDQEHEIEGMPLLHLEGHRAEPDRPGFADWFDKFGMRRSGTDRGPYYRRANMALDAVRQDVGFLLCGISLIEGDLDTGSLVLPYPASMGLTAPCPYRLWQRETGHRRPQMRRFVEWVKAESAATARWISDMQTRPGPDAA